MNIFVVDEDPYLAARHLCDRHVVKMIVESCQLLSTADQLFRNHPKDGRYKIAYRHHPCVRCLQNESNYVWLIHHLGGLLDEYFSRYGKVHSCQNMFSEYWEDFVWKDLDFSRTNFPKCMPKELQEESVVRSYRKYYTYKKDHLKSFKYKIKDHYPEWLKI